MSREQEIPTFDSFWEYVILPSIKRCVSEMDENFKKKIRFEYRKINSYKDELSVMFKRKREWLKREYLPNKGSEAVLDFHKLSSIFCRCIIGNKPFFFTKRKAEALFKQITERTDISDEEKLNLEVNNIYVNYKCAFLVCAGVAYIDLLYWANEKMEREEDSRKKEIYCAFLERLKEEKKLVQYKKSINHDDYVTSMIVAFMKNDILLRDFDYLAIAASMFQWQVHTKHALFLEILSESDIDKIDMVAYINELI